MNTFFFTSACISYDSGLYLFAYHQPRPHFVFGRVITGKLNLDSVGPKIYTCSLRSGKSGIGDLVVMQSLELHPLPHHYWRGSMTNWLAAAGSVLFMSVSQ